MYVQNVTIRMYVVITTFRALSKKERKENLVMIDQLFYCFRFNLRNLRALWLDTERKKRRGVKELGLCVRCFGKFTEFITS